MDKCAPLVAIRYNCFSVENVRAQHVLIQLFMPSLFR
jgi:hypothetical protein